MTAHEFQIFETVLKKRGRAWTWRVCTIEGDIVMRGLEGTRHAAQYNANRALFLLLLTSPYRLKRPNAVHRWNPRLFGPPPSVG
jgi:hypothetical protein